MKNTKNVKANENTKATATTETKATKLDLTKESKASLVANLRTLLPKVISEDDALGAKIDKALKSKKTTLEDLKALMTSVVELGKKPAPKTVVEAEEKPKKKVTAKKTEKVASKTEKPAKVEKKKTENKSQVQTVQTAGDITAPLATIFPATITTQIDGEDVVLTKAKSNEFTSIQDIVEAMDSKIIVFACYWTKRHIKEFNYALTFSVASPKSFKDDLDLCIAAWECPTIKRLFAMSLETEAVYYFEEGSLTPIEDSNPYNGEKYQIRVSNGMEFEIYTADAPAE